MATREFEHYDGCGHRDVNNCGACALTDTRQERPNYAGWPLVYMENRRAIPAKWRKAFQAEVTDCDNSAYVANIIRHIRECGVVFTDSKPWHWRGRSLKIDRIVQELAQ